MAPRLRQPLSPEERRARMDRLRKARAIERSREEQLATAAKALAHPARVSILQALAGERITCGEIVEAVPLAQSTISQHLKVLKEAGLVSGMTLGPSTRYGLSERGIRELRVTLEHFLPGWERAVRPDRSTGY